MPSTIHGVPPVRGQRPECADCPHLPIDIVLAGMRHLYSCQGLSARRIAALLDVDRARVVGWLRRAGLEIRPRGAGRRRPERRVAAPNDLRALLVKLYVEQRRPAREVGELLGFAERTVRDRLREYGIARRTRGRLNREDRRALPMQLLCDLYAQAGLSADEVGRRIGVSRAVVLRNAHDLGIPVRAGGSWVQGTAPDIELIDALYADPLVMATIHRHDLPQVPAGGQLWERFPVPSPLSGELAVEFYRDCGLSTFHIELLTGQPSDTVRRILLDAGVTLRPPGGRSPFLRRCRAGRQGDGGGTIAGR